MNADRLARSYRFFEWAAFGRRLERHRFHFLPLLTSCRRALILGDGDGRFGARLAAALPHLEMDFVELSPRMIDVAATRLCHASVNCKERIRFHQADARLYPFAANRYDLVVSHFFLDCFGTEDVNELCRRVAAGSSPGAYWLISEFQQPPGGWRALHARLWLKTMYAFFRVATGLTVNSLPDYAAALEAAGFKREQQQTSMAGLIASQLWVRRNRWED